MFNYSKTKLKKILILFLVIALTYSNFILVGTNVYKGLVSYAADDTKMVENLIKEEKNEEEPLFEIGMEALDIHKTKMEEETNFTSKVNLKLKNVKNILLEDEPSTFYNKNDEEIEDISLKYVKTTLNKEELKNILGKNGTFSVLDDEENVLVKLSLADFQKLNLDEKTPQKFRKIVEEENEEGELVKKEQEEIRTYVTANEETIEIEYELNVKNLKFKVENEFNNEEINFVIENTKSIFDVKDLDELNYLKESIKYTFEKLDKEENKEDKTEEDILLNEEQEEKEEPVVESLIQFKDTVTRAQFNLEQTEWVVGEENRANYKILLDTQTEKSELYKNPIFIIELPESVESINTKNSQFTIENENGVFEERNVTIANLLGRKYIVINLKGEQTQDSIANGNATINLSLYLNLKEGAEGNQETKLYYKNNTVTVYENDMAFGTNTVTNTVKSIEIINEPENVEEEPVEEQETTTEENPEGNGLFVTLDSNTNLVKVGDEFEYSIYLYNTETNALNSVVIEDKIPDGLEYVGVGVYNHDPETYGYTDEVDANNVAQYNEETKTLKVEFNNFEAATLDESTEIASIIDVSKLVKIKVKASALEENTYSKEIENNVTVTKDGLKLPTKNKTVTVSDAVLQVEVKKIEDELAKNDVVEFELVVNNLGLVVADNAKIEYKLPEEFKAMYVETNEYSYSIDDNDFSTTAYIPAKGSFKMKLAATYANVVDENTDVQVVASVDDNSNVWETKLLNKESDNSQNENSAVTTMTLNAPSTQNNDEKFNLSLNQILSKITVKNSKESKEYTYNNNTKFAKVEIAPKKMSDTTVTMQYKIIVKNEGTVPAYASKIVDYIPEGLIFEQEKNKDWYKAEDGNVYSVSLMDRELNPGETANLTIELSKKMTNDNTGIVKNVVEIYEASNKLGLKDENSIPGDAVEKQDDMAAVEVIIAVELGTIMLYIMLGVVIVAIIGYGVYMVKKLALKKGAY